MTAADNPMVGRAPWWRCGLARRALTRPLWWWHRRRPWPIRAAAFNLPPIRVMPGWEANTRVITQCAPTALADAAWAAYSFLRGLNAPDLPLALTLHLDTNHAETLATCTRLWQGLFPGAEVRSASEPLARLEARAPAVVAFARGSAVGRKLAVLLDCQQYGQVLFVDSDVLLFQHPPELLAAMRAGGPAMYNLEDGPLNGDARLVAWARSHGWPEPASLNSGLLFIPKGGLDIADAERLVGSGEFDSGSWFVEQTTVALLLTAAGARALPPERYVVSTVGQFYGETDRDYGAMVTRHFTTPVRHLMYGKGMPMLWKEWRGRGG